MNNQKYIIIAVVAVLVIGGIVLFSNNKESDEYSTYATPSGTNTNTNKTPGVNNTGTPGPLIPPPNPNQVMHGVNISNFAFAPSTITVKKGETIVWTNKDSSAHTVTGGNLDSESLAQNQTYSFAFDRAGTYSYHCALHPNMKGTVIVTE